MMGSVEEAVLAGLRPGGHITTAVVLKQKSECSHADWKWSDVYELVQLNIG